MVVPMFGDAVAGAGISSAVTSIIGVLTRVMGNAIQLVIAAGKKAAAYSKFIWNKGQKLKDFLFKKLKHVKNYAQRLAHFNKYIQMMMKFAPIFYVFAGIILVFTNALYYVVLAIAYVAVALIQISHFILGLPPFIYLVFFLGYFLFVDIVPFLMIACVWVALLVVITLLCCILAFLNEITNGKISHLILCQNSPTAWYSVPSYQHGNRFRRGILCSMPCAKGYKPDGEVSSTCEKLPSGTPNHCPQANVMRSYIGTVGSDGQVVYPEFAVKGNMSYLVKPPSQREEILLKHFLERIKYLERCNNPTNVYTLNKYDAITKTICSNLDILKEKMDAKDYARLSMACNQAFCNSKTSYPFCGSLSMSKDVDMAELFKKILYAIIAISVFSLVLITVVNELSLLQ